MAPLRSAGPEQLHYLQSRGIFARAATAMLVRGFLDEVNRRIEAPEVGELLQARVDRGLAAPDAAWMQERIHRRQRAAVDHPTVDLTAVRDDFPMLDRLVHGAASLRYLDNAATLSSPGP